MAGPRNLGQISSGDSTRGHIDPQKARVNFATPSLQTLSQKVGGPIDLPKSCAPGMITPTLDAIEKSGKDTVYIYMMYADAKRVTAGVSTGEGDVDMFGHEEGGTLSERKQRLKEEEDLVSSAIHIVDNHGVRPDCCLAELPEDARIELLVVIKAIIRKLSYRSRDAWDLKMKQTIGVKKLLALGGDTWRNSKYQYATSGLQASLYQLSSLLQSTLSTIGTLCLCACSFNGSEDLYCRGS